jgi:two-component system, response regulator
MGPTMARNTILLAEDNIDDEALALRAFRKRFADVDIIVAHNGIEVMDYLCARGRYAGRNPEDLPKVLLLDLKMPLMDGLETLKRIRDTTHARLLPIVVLTSSDELKDQIESYQNGANGYVLKPVKYEEFVEAANRIGEYWLTLNQSPAHIHVES